MIDDLREDEFACIHSTIPPAQLNPRIQGKSPMAYMNLLILYSIGYLFLRQFIIKCLEKAKVVRDYTDIDSWS